MWNIGSEYILKELPLIDTFGDDYIGNDAATTKWLRENTTIPVVQEMKYWRDGNSHFFLMRRMPGESLQDAWPRLSIDEKKMYACEVIEYIAELRKHKAASPQTVEGALVRDTLLGSSRTSMMVIEDKETWWARVVQGFPDSNPAWLEKYKLRYPRQPTQYVLTHGDLSPGNIMIHDGHVSGIIDWEHAGYFPDWWEHACALVWTNAPQWQRFILDEMENQLKTEFGNYRDAADFCRSFRNQYKKPTGQYQPAKNRGNFCDCKPDF
jgi:aminoglycoside phosphotransferase (APT) family kinase protein